MAGRLAGKVAIVTGTGAGIGKGIATMFAREGAAFGCDIRAAQLDHRLGPHHRWRRQRMVPPPPSTPA